MKISLTSNVADIAGRWRGRAAAIPREQRRAAAEIAPVLEREATRILRVKLYAVPIPAGKHGPAWHRTGNLIAAEKWTADGTDVVGANSSDHAGARFSLGKPGGRQIKSPGVVPLDWQREAVANKRSFILQVRAAHNRTAMRGR